MKTWLTLSLEYQRYFTLARGPEVASSAHPASFVEPINNRQGEDNFVLAIAPLAAVFNAEFPSRFREEHTGQDRSFSPGVRVFLIKWPRR